jgi:hypothetical protein
MKKLYTLVRKDLSPSQRAVQACHAVAEFLLKGNLQGWDNGTMVVLSVPRLEDLEAWQRRLSIDGHETVAFVEPDIGDQKTAFSFVGDANLDAVRSLPLL